MITEVDKKIVAALNKGEEYWTFKEDAERDYVHGLFAYPAMMVPKMQREILDVFDHQLAWSHTPTIYDPFMGSGTILVEGMLKGYNIVGVDINPLAYLVAKVKTEIYSLNRLRKSINVLFERIKNTNDVEVATDFDNIQKWFKPEIIRELDLIKQQIRLEPSLKFRRLMWVAFCDTVRLVSNARSCTYKLYIKTQKSIDNFDKSAIDMFYECLESAYTGIASFQQELQNKGFLKKNGRRISYTGTIFIYLADTTRVSAHICKQYAPDIVITSPPYGDNETTVTYGQYSVLALRWMDIQDIKKGIDGSIIESQSKIDRISLGGKIQKQLCAQYRQELRNKAPTLEEQLTEIEQFDQNKTSKVISFYHDFDEFVGSLNGLKSDSYVVMTVGNRTVAKQRIKMDKILQELFEFYDFDFSFEFSRRIINKRMSVVNAIDPETGTLLESMTKEYILIMKKR